MSEADPDLRRYVVPFTITGALVFRADNADVVKMAAELYSIQELAALGSLEMGDPEDRPEGQR